MPNSMRIPRRKMSRKTEDPGEEETTDNSWEPAENAELDEDTTPENEPESWEQGEEEETEPDDNTMETGETSENEDETYA